MAQWDDGYVSDVVYTNNFYRECTPSWMATTALLLGHRPPDLSRPFRYADLGSANGYTALVIAATAPQAEVWGFDFNPSHIETARSIADRAGLTNIRFVETSFADLAELPASVLPEFDFMASHGVLSWISPKNQAALIRVLGQRLRAGGLAYLSYNVLTGWTSMMPLRALMRQLLEASQDRSDQAVPAILDYLERLRAGGALFFQANPGAEARLTEVRRQDPRYIAHEFLNADWHPAMFTDVAGAMAAVKCGFVGSTTLSENIDGVSVPPGVAALLNESKDPVLRETLRDFGSGQGFRRDLYRRGTPPLPTAEHHRLLDELVIASTGQVAADPFTITTPIGTVTGRPEIYRPLLEMLDSGPVALGHVRAQDAFASRSLLELLQAVALLISSGHVHPVPPAPRAPEARDAAARLNRVVAQINADGGDMPRVVLPLLGSAANVDMLESLAIGELLDGQPADVATLAGAVQSKLARSGRSVQRDGDVVSDPEQARDIVARALVTVLERRVPALRALGVLPA